jgi:hypothetical protein
MPITTIETEHPLHHAEDVWYAPFFFADSRNVFYVTTTATSASLSAPMGYGGGISSTQPTVAIPPVVLHRVPLLDGGVDMDSVTRFVTEDANIRIGISTSASVRYGDREMGPAGVLSNGQKR